MEDFIFFSLAIPRTLIFSLILKLLYAFWWRPMKLGRCIKGQGINGPPYRPTVGNIMEETHLRNEAKLRPMDLSHAIVPHFLPFLHRISKSYSISQILILPNVTNVPVGPTEAQSRSLSHSYAVSITSL